MGNYLATFLANTFFNQYFLLFVAAALGALLGRVKIKGFTLGSTGGIFTGIVIGWAVQEIAQNISNDFTAITEAGGQVPTGLKAAYDGATMGNASTIVSSGVVPSSNYVQFIFLLLFIAAVGLLVGKKLKNVLNLQGVKLIVMGVFIPIVSMGLTLGCLAISPGLMGDAYNGYQISGLYSGAMTNSAAYGNSMAVITGIGAQSVREQYAALDNAEKVRALEQIPTEGIIISEKEDGSRLAILKWTQDENGENGENGEVVFIPATVSSYRDFLTQKADSGEIELPEEISIGAANVFLGKAKGQVATGYAISFPVATIVVILTMTIFGILVNKGGRRDEDVAATRAENAGGTIQAGTPGTFFFDAVVFGLVIGIGILIGNIKIPLGGGASFSLGPVGGTLIMALIFGNINKMGRRSIIQNPKVLNLIREFALLFFMSVTGLENGYSVIHAFGGSAIWIALMSIVIVVVVILLSIVLGRLIFKLSWGMLAGAISGGCTSTVGLGASLNTIGGDEPILGYGVSQPFAILANVILIALFHQNFFI